MVQVLVCGENLFIKVKECSIPILLSVALGIRGLKLLNCRVWVVTHLSSKSSGEKYQGAPIHTYLLTGLFIFQVFLSQQTNNNFVFNFKITIICKTTTPNFDQANSIGGCAMKTYRYCINGLSK